MREFRNVVKKKLLDAMTSYNCTRNAFKIVACILAGNVASAPPRPFVFALARAEPSWRLRGGVNPTEGAALTSHGRQDM